ncbi:MAG: 5-bromo-4-chloroindolyl phosphate hydrolysis family protein [Christensenellales bacterium]|jgi:hypothetical protein
MQNNAYNAHGQAGQDDLMPVPKKRPAPFYAVAGFWLLYALVFPLYRWMDYLIAGALSAALFFILEKALPPKIEYVPRPREIPFTGPDAAEQIIRAGETFVKRLHQADTDIDDEIVSGQIVQLSLYTKKITDHIREHPDKAPRVRRFMTYYLPMLMGLLDAYAQAEQQEVDSANISAIKRRVESSLENIITAFSRQLDALFEDRVIDISADIQVLENMFAREGFIVAASEQPGSEPAATEEEEENGRGPIIPLETIRKANKR